MGITRGTTPTNIFDVDLDLTDAEVVYYTYSQDGVTVFEKTKEDLDITPSRVTIKLSQKDTLKLNHSKPVEIQARARFVNGDAPASCIIVTTAERILKNGVI